MISSNSAKVFFILLLTLSQFSACRWWQKGEDGIASPTPFVASEIKDTIPFSTKEPENFQAEFVITALNKEDKVFVLKKENARRIDYNYGQKIQVSTLKTAANENFLILSAKKIYAENSDKTNFQTEENPFEFLTNELLNQKTTAKFESLETENGIRKFLARSEENVGLESIIWFDQAIGLPIKQEFYSINGEQKQLTFTFEMKNFKSPADDGSFEIPKDFRKISVEEFHKILTSEPPA